MTDWLVRHFVREHEHVDDPAVRIGYGRLASVVSVACNVALFVAKAAVGVAAGSIAIVADAANSLTDAASNVVALLGFTLAAKPPDAEHPYGHGRYEYLSAMVVAVIVVLIGLDMARDALGRVLDPQPVSFGAATVATLALSVVVKLWMAHLNATLGRRISSKTLAATATDSLGDAAATAAVLASGIVTRITGVALDGPAGVAVGALIVWNGYELVRDTVDTLLGRAPDPELARRVRTRVLATPGVVGMHDLMVHDYGPGRLFASAHVEMAPDCGMLESHDRLDAIEHDLLTSERLSITLHLDPVGRHESMDGPGVTGHAGTADARPTGPASPASTASLNGTGTTVVGEAVAGRGAGVTAGSAATRARARRKDGAMSPKAYKAKQMIVVRRDLRMRKGKIAAQAGHACVEATLMALAREGRLDEVRVTQDDSWVYLDDGGRADTPLAAWFDAGVAKVCVYVDGEEALLELAAQGRDLGFLCALVRDAGITEFGGEATYTCLAFEPLYPEQIDPLTGELPLY